MVGDITLYNAFSLPKAKAEPIRAMRMLLSFLALGAAYVCAIAVESPMNRLVAETLTLLSTHRTRLIGDGVIFFFESYRHR